MPLVSELAIRTISLKEATRALQTKPAELMSSYHMRPLCLHVRVVDQSGIQRASKARSFFECEGFECDLAVADLHPIQNLLSMIGILLPREVRKSQAAGLILVIELQLAVEQWTKDAAHF